MHGMKDYSELCISDPFMFGKVCSKPENSELIIRALLGIDVKLTNCDIEKYLKEVAGGKYIRLDLLAQDDKGRIYNAEMQNESWAPARQLELPRRSRYYQSIIDQSSVREGQDYMDIPETYIIFICTFDPFGKGLGVYSFDMLCREDLDIELNDGVHRLFFNTTANKDDMAEPLRNMLEYIQTGVASDGATSKLDIEVLEGRLKAEWRAEYMLAAVHDMDMKKAGEYRMIRLIQELKKAGRIEDIVKIADDEVLRNKLYTEFNIVD